MAIRKQQTMEVAAPYPFAFDAICRALVGLGITIKQLDEAHGQIDGLWPIGLASWGEKIHVEVRQIGAQVTGVSFSSALRVGVVDWGKNQKNIVKIEAAILETVAAGPVAPS